MSYRMDYVFTLNGHGDIIEVMVVGFIPCFEVPPRKTS